MKEEYILILKEIFKKKYKNIRLDNFKIEHNDFYYEFKADDIVSENDIVNGVSLQDQSIVTSATAIASYALAGTGVKQVTANSATEIKANAACGNTKLAEIVAPNVTMIRQSAFMGCTSLVRANYPEVVELLYAMTDQYQFSGCTSLAEVNMPKVTIMGAGVFENCKALTSISFPALTTFNVNTTAQFKGCISLTDVNLPLLTKVFSSTFENCTSLKEISLPSVTQLNTKTFGGCTALEKVDLGACESFGNINPFQGATALTTVILRYNGVVAVSNATYGFAGATQAKTVYVPAAQLEAYQAHSYWGSTAQTTHGVTLATIEGSEYE